MAIFAVILLRNMRYGLRFLICVLGFLFGEALNQRNRLWSEAA